MSARRLEGGHSSIPVADVVLATLPAAYRHDSRWLARRGGRWRLRLPLPGEIEGTAPPGVMVLVHRIAGDALARLPIRAAALPCDLEVLWIWAEETAPGAVGRAMQRALEEAKSNAAVAK